jgi:hypothetical protein
VIGFAVIEPGPADVVIYPRGTVEVQPQGSGASVADAWNAAEQIRLARAVAEAQLPDEDELATMLQARLDEWHARTTAELARREREARPGVGSPEGRRSNYLLHHPEPTLESLLAELTSARTKEFTPARVDTRERSVTRCTGLNVTLRR